MKAVEILYFNEHKLFPLCAIRNGVWGYDPLYRLWLWLLRVGFCAVVASGVLPSFASLLAPCALLLLRVALCHARSWCCSCPAGGFVGETRFAIYCSQFWVWLAASIFIYRKMAN